MRENPAADSVDKPEARTDVEHDIEPSADSTPSGGVDSLDLKDLDFDARLAMLAKQYENAVPITKEERDRLQEERVQDDDEKWWTPAFWALVRDDLKSLQWASFSKVFQTLYISQIAFVMVVMLVLFFDAIFDSAIRALLLGEPFSITVEKILKASNNGM
eukprot:CAMPEP_0119329590 /NCGR_PEP_ID=MMETSP1333-20130426/76211_1 /TAXON_ID=418940 /ORGANISM="Scyphosphaera apsteinii, Strain RCC1455" /LENGTH=159 /DNA_ID=CAMNT_0007338747 /DNA_START=141 /DNA_END=620 /DNA_ORIENTATION=+